MDYDKNKNQLNIFYRFGAAIHYALKEYVMNMENPFVVFDEYWERYKDESEWIYKEGESWESHHALGNELIQLFVKQFPLKGIIPILAENRLKNFDTGASKQQDLIGHDKFGNYVVVDYKITETPVEWLDVMEQLIEGALLVQQEFSTDGPFRLICCNFIKSKKSIEWLEEVVTGDDIREYKTRSRENDSVLELLDLT